MNWRLYTALFYLKNNNLEAFYDLLLINNKINNIKENKDLLYLHENGYIKFISYSKIILLQKSEDVLEKKNKKENIEKKIELDDHFLNDFSKGFPIDRYGQKDELRRVLQSFLNTHNEYTKDEIIEAKNKYIKSKSAENFTYVLKTNNFVLKELENYLRFNRLEKERPNSNNISTNGTILDW